MYPFFPIFAGFAQFMHSLKGGIKGGDRDCYRVGDRCGRLELACTPQAPFSVPVARFEGNCAEVRSGMGRSV